MYGQLTYIVEIQLCDVEWVGRGVPSQMVLGLNCRRNRKALSNRQMFY